MGRHLSKFHEYKEIGDAEYITQLLCENRSKIMGSELKYNFWLLPEWRGFYRVQLKKVGELLKHYTAECIIAAINKHNHSVCGDNLAKRAKEEQALLDTKIQAYIKKRYPDKGKYE